MLKRLANAVRGRGEIGRLEFLAGIALVAVVAGVTWQYGPAWLAEVVDEPNFLILRALLTIVVWGLVTLISAARLRDLGWPAWLSLIFLTNALFSLTVLAAYQQVTGRPFVFPDWWVVTGAVFNALNVIFAAILLVWDRKLAEKITLQHRAWLLLLAYVLPMALLLPPLGEQAAKLEELQRLPALTERFLPLVPATPFFILGTVPALLVLLMRNARPSTARKVMVLAGGMFVAYLVWAGLLWLAIGLPARILSQIG